MILYKFYRATSNNKDNIINQQIWLSEIREFNDPFEGNIEFDRRRFAAENIEPFVIGKDKEYINAIRNEFNKVEHSEIIDKNVDALILKLTEGTRIDFCRQYGICAKELEKIRNQIPFVVTCFSKFDNDEEMLQNIVMWSHYADQHRGFCVKYRIDDNAPIVEHLFDVEYNQINRLNVSELKELLNDLNSDESQRILINRLKHKYYQWEYEKEKRLIISTNNKCYTKIGKGGLMPFEHKIEKIFFGLKMERNLCREIINNCHDKVEEIYFTYRDENTNKLKCSEWKNERFE